MLASLGSTNSVIVVRDSLTLFPSNAIPPLSNNSPHIPGRLPVPEVLLFATLPVNFQDAGRSYLTEAEGCDIVQITMVVNDLDLVTVLVFIMVGLVILQSVGLVIMLAKSNARLQEAESRLQRYSVQMRPLLANLRDALERLKWIPGQLQAFEETTENLLTSVVGGLETANERFKVGLGAGCDRIEEAGRKIEYGLSTFSRQTTRVHRSIRYPASNFSALIHGLTAGIETLRGDKKDPTRHYQEEEDFI